MAPGSQLVQRGCQLWLLAGPRLRVLLPEDEGSLGALMPSPLNSWCLLSASSFKLGSPTHPRTHTHPTLTEWGTVAPTLSV